MTGFRFNEKYLSQIPALQLLINLGYEYLSPEQVMKQRQKKLIEKAMQVARHRRIR